jgi:hypothetical protein
MLQVVTKYLQGLRGKEIPTDEEDRELALIALVVLELLIEVIVHDRGVGVVDDSAGFVAELGGDIAGQALRASLDDATDGCWWGLLEECFEGGGISGYIVCRNWWLFLRRGLSGR